MEGQKAIEYPDGRGWPDRIPVYKVGLIWIKLIFDRKENKSPLQYTKETEKICNGSTGKPGDICEIECPNLDSKVPIGQTDYDGDGKVNQFQCNCSIDPENPEDYVCYWRPVEHKWLSMMTCDPKRNMKKSPKGQFRLVNWWNKSPHSQSRWDDSIGMLKKHINPFTATGTF